LVTRRIGDLVNNDPLHVSLESDVGPVREGEALDWGALAAWLRIHLPADCLPDADRSRKMDVAQFPGGHSNLTYRVTFGETEFVLRRPPLGPVPPTAHDMAREFRWLSAVHPVFPLAPRVFALCDDRSVVGSVFYVMERRHGIVVRRAEPPSWREDRPLAPRSAPSSWRRSPHSMRWMLRVRRSRCLASPLDSSAVR